MEFYLDASAKAIRLKSSNPFVKDWAPLNLLAEKSTDPGEEELYFFKVTGLVNNPSQVKKLRAYARNQLGRETTYSAALPLIFPSGPPVVTLNTFMGVYYATRTVLGDTDVYYSTDAVDGPISFLAAALGTITLRLTRALLWRPLCWSISKINRDGMEISVSRRTPAGPQFPGLAPLTTPRYGSAPVRRRGFITFILWAIASTQPRLISPS